MMPFSRKRISPAVVGVLTIGAATLLTIAPETSAFVHPAASPSTRERAALSHTTVGVSHPSLTSSSSSTALSAKKKKKKGGGKKGGGGNKKSGFEWASSFTIKPFEAQLLRDLASTTLASFEGRTGKPLCEELSGAADLPKALWNAPMACVVVGPPPAAGDDDGKGVVVKYANAAALETVGLGPDEFEKFIAPDSAAVDAGKAMEVTVDLPPIMKGDKKYEGGYKKKILRKSPASAGDEGEGESAGVGDDVTILHAQRWAIEKSLLIRGKFVTETIGVAYAWAEWTVGEDVLCSPGGKRGPNVRPDDLEEAVAAQADVVRELKQDQGLGNKDPQVVEAVGELLRLKALLAAAAAE